MSERENESGETKNPAECDGGINTTAEQSNAELKQALEFARKKLRIVGNVTRHDVLNQLTAIVGYNELLGMAVEDPQQRLFIAREKQALDKIRRQFKFAKDYQNIGVEPPRWLLLKSVIHQAIEEVDLKTIRVTDLTGSAMVYADPSFEKVFSNLFENTLLYSGSANEIRISVSQKEGVIMLVVEDNGMGIPQENKTKVFERGYGKGTGWGLFLAKEILSFTGMAIQENGEPGKGGRFEIMISHNHFRTDGVVSQVPAPGKI